MTTSIAQLYGRQYTVPAPAKLNLRLKVEGRRADGYHLLSMLNVAVDLCDELTVCLGRSGGVTISKVHGGNEECLHDLQYPEKNLAARAAREFIREFDLPLGVDIQLTKNIQVGAGLAGGSSDAAAVLKILSAECQPAICETKQISAASFQEKVLGVALRLGADVPFFLGAPFAHVAGIGEEIQELDWRVVAGLDFWLIVPRVSLLTSEIYQAYRLRFPRLESCRDEIGRAFVAKCTNMSGYLEREALREELLGLIENDLEPLVCEASDEVRALLGRLREFRSLRVGLTGSGAAVFCVAPERDLKLANTLSRMENQGCLRMLNVRPVGPD